MFCLSVCLFCSVCPHLTFCTLEQDGYFGVTVTGDALSNIVCGEDKATQDSMNLKIEQTYKEAYHKGEMNTQEKYKDALKHMGEETQSVYISAMKEMHEKEATSSLSMLENLRGKLSVAPPDKLKVSCSREELSLVKCLHVNKGLVDCREFGDMYTACVKVSI